MKSYLFCVFILLGACKQTKLNVNSTSQSGTSNTPADATPTPTGNQNSSTLQIDKSTYDFGVALIGQSYTATFTLTNSGSTTVSSISGSGLSSELSFMGGSFPGTNGTCSTSLSAGASCTIVLSLVPTSSGSLSQTLSVSYSDGSSNTSSVTLTLTATKSSASPASLFERTGTPQSRQAYEYYGTMVVTDGTNLAVLASSGLCSNNGANCGSKGSVFIYSKSGSSWVFDNEIVPYTYTECSGLSAIDLDSGRLAVGCSGDSYKATTATFNASNAGSVKTYKKNGSSWDFEKKIFYDGPGAAGSSLGITLSLSGNTLAIGAKFHSLDENDANSVASAGAVFVYTYSTTWTFQQKLVSTVREASEAFGYDISIDGDTLVVGSPYHKTDASGANSLTNAGAAFIFVRSGTTWSLQQKIVPTGTNARNASDGFGVSVSLDQDTLAVGASGHSYDGSGASLLSST